MKIKEVKIKNFRGYGVNKNSYDGFFSFENLDEYDLVILSGYNGFGKTSFYDAIEWCLTDKIQRLVELNDVFKQGKNNLKKSEYLQFNKENLNEGKAEVAISLVNGREEYFIRRVTSCKSFQDNDYKSICYNQYNEELTEKDIALYVDNDDLNNINEKIEYMVKSSILGQERMNDFLRLNNPNQRKDAIFNLVGLNDIPEINQLAQKKKLNYPKTLISEMEKIEKDYKESKEEIEKWFKIKGFGTFDNYLIHVENDIKSINSNINKLDIQLDEFSLENKITPENIIKVVDNYIQFNNTINQKENIINNRITESIKTWYIRRLNYINEQLNKLKFVQEFKYEILNDNIKKREEKIDLYNNGIVKLDEVKEKLSLYKDIEDKERYSIKYEKGKFKIIQVENANKLIKDKEKFYSIFKEYDEIGLLKYKDKISPDIINKINDINIQIRNSIDSLNNIDKKRQSLNIINSNNNEYSKALEEVRKIIIDKNLQECPVCKNNNFDSMIENKDMLRNDKNSQLLYIISETISNGNNEILKLQGLLDTDEKQLKVVNDSIIEQVSEILSEFSTMSCYILKDYNNIKEYIEKQYQCMINRKGNCINEVQDLKTKLNIFNSNTKEFNDKFKDKKLETIKEFYFNLKMYYTKVLQEKYEVSSISNTLNNNLVSTKDLLELINKSKLNQKLKQLFINLDKYKMTDIERKNYKSFIEHNNKIDEIKILIDRLKTDVKYYDNIVNNVQNAQEEIIKKLVNDNSLAIWIYEQINPHPLYTTFKFKIDGNGTNIVSKDNDNIFFRSYF
ncbi:hypothetical protein AWN73_10990 [Clostridium butyricum]|uniref:Nuclease SbcCD subunit C n=1 Tax=Clostridium butyricum TaxID=1492 RepID=A0A2S7FBV9_CLOBU|nr:AAA family ATPase [Clostridium butyricum]PPV15604.1 hypothetical protein AWN73_10990 [Clostridium butyricum]